VLANLHCEQSSFFR